MKLAPIFTSEMVLQANMPLRFFGTGAGTVKITIDGRAYQESFYGETWLMELPRQPYRTPTDIMVEINGLATVLSDVAFGDVFLFAGQSNVQFPVKEEVCPTPIIADEKIRYYQSKRDGSHCAWKSCIECEYATWSALALRTAINYRKASDVYVGIVTCAVGASVIQSWIPMGAIPHELDLPPEQLFEDHTIPDYSAWNKPGILYRDCFRPVVPMAFKSAVWYQGESNASPAEGQIYLELLKILINCWRTNLRSPTLPFVVVQICDFVGCDNVGWHGVQERQAEAEKEIPYVTTVTSNDVCDHEHIHPVDKEKLAQKIANVI